MNSKKTSIAINKQNIDALDLAVQENYVNQKHSEEDQSRKIVIMFEYKMLQMYGPLFGVYAVPNLDDYNVWNCVICVRKGFYKDGKFKFDLRFPDKFPHVCPEIQFKSMVFHPLVDEQQGIVDVKSIINGKWNYSNENMLYNLIMGLEQMFTVKSKMQITTSYNPQAARLLATKPHSFIQKALLSVENSHENLYVNQPGTSFVINKYNNGQIDPLKAKLQTLCRQNRAPEEKRKQFLAFLLEQ